MSMARVKGWVRYTVTRLQQADETSEIVCQVLDNSTQARNGFLQCLDSPYDSRDQPTTKMAYLNTARR
jgi:hypothetical protein